MSTDELRHIACVVCLISSCVTFSLMTKKDFKGNRRVVHATNQTIPEQPSDIQHLTTSTTLLPNSPCAQCSMISRRSFIALRNYPKYVPWQPVSNPFPAITYASCRHFPPTSTLRTTYCGDLVRFCVRSEVQQSQSFGSSHEAFLHIGMQNPNLKIMPPPPPTSAHLVTL